MIRRIDNPFLKEYTKSALNAGIEMIGVFAMQKGKGYLK